jgi:hypothetical protein
LVQAAQVVSSRPKLARAILDSALEVAILPRETFTELVRKLPSSLAHVAALRILNVTANRARAALDEVRFDA